jgi:hypothetical protein
MAQNTGTLIGAAIRPNDTNDKIASAFAVEVKGGHHTYDTISARNSIIAERREWGMLCTVYNDPTVANNATYILQYGYVDNTITNNSNWVKFTGSGALGSDYWTDPVISIESNEPGSPSDGDRYIVGSSPTGTNWSSISTNKIVQWNSTISLWVQTAPLNGVSVRVNDEDNSIYRYEGDSSSWIKEKENQVVYLSATSSNGTAFNATTSRIFAYETDTLYMIQFATSNAGTTPTLNINGLGAKSIKQQTNAGILNLTANDINTSLVYNLNYDGTYFLLTRPTSDPTLVRYRILSNEKVTVPAYQEYLVYGNLEVNGILDVDTNGKVVVINGALNVNGGTVSNSSNVSLVTLGGSSGSVVNKYSATFSMTGGTTYSVAHNLGTNAYCLTTFDESTGEVIQLDAARTVGYETTNVDLYSVTTLNNVRVVIVG